MEMSFVPSGGTFSFLDSVHPHVKSPIKMLLNHTGAQPEGPQRAAPAVLLHFSP